MRNHPVIEKLLPWKKSPGVVKGADETPGDGGGPESAHPGSTVKSVTAKPRTVVFMAPGFPRHLGPRQVTRASP